MDNDTRIRRLFVGWDAESNEKVEIVLDQPVVKNPHVVVFGQPGSGKTVFCKALIEEAARNGIPCFVVDPQGDLSSLAIMGDLEKVKEKGTGEDVWTSYRDRVSVAIFTPASSKGIPISVNPIKLRDVKGTGDEKMTEEEVIQAIEGATIALCRFLYFDPEKDDGRLVAGFLNRLLKYYYDAGQPLSDIPTLASVVSELPGDASKLAEGYIKDPMRKKLAMLLRASLEGMRGHLLTHGVQLNMEKLVQPRNGKTPINIFYLNTLPSIELKQFFVAVLVNQIYQWMLAQTSAGEFVPLRLILYIDEAAPFVPSGMSKTIAKRALQPLITQSRKYGVGIFFSTQTPGSMDGYMLGQANTIVTGQLQTDLDLRRVDEIVEAMMKEATETVLQKIRLLPAGNFFLISPQQSRKLKLIRTRWLVTEHRIVSDDALREITDKDALEFFQQEIEEAEETATPPPAVVEEIPQTVIQEEKQELNLDEVYLKMTPGTVTREMLEASITNPSRIVLVPQKRHVLYIPVLGIRRKMKLAKEFKIPTLEKPVQISIDIPLNKFIILSQSIPVRKYLQGFENPEILFISPETILDENDLSIATYSLGSEQELSPPATPSAVAIQRDLRKTMENVRTSLQGKDQNLRKDQLLNELSPSQIPLIFAEVKRKLEHYIQVKLDELRSTLKEIQVTLQNLKERLLKIEELGKKALTEQTKARGIETRQIAKNIQELEELKKEAMSKTQTKLKESENTRTAIDKAELELIKVQKQTPQETMKSLTLFDDRRSLTQFNIDEVTIENGLILRVPTIVIEGEATHHNEKEKLVALLPGRGKSEAHGVCLYQGHGEATRPITLCKTCLTATCDMHTYTCAMCGEPLCPDHAFFCNTCGVALCDEHKRTCADEECRVVLCDSHVTQCENCRKHYCKKHIHETKKGPLLLKTRKLLCSKCM